MTEGKHSIFTNDTENNKTGGLEMKLEIKGISDPFWIY